MQIVFERMERIMNNLKHHKVNLVYEPLKLLLPMIHLCHSASCREAPAAGPLLNLHTQAVLLSQWLKCLKCLKCSSKGCSSVPLMCKIWAENSKAKLHSKEERALDKGVAMRTKWQALLLLALHESVYAIFFKFRCRKIKSIVAL